MSDTNATSAQTRDTRRGMDFLWRRSLQSYPEPGPRYFYLFMVVLATVVLYYSLYIQYGVAPSIMSHYGMSFTFFVWIAVLGNALGAFASLIAGLGQRIGRANFTVYGVLLVALLLFALANAPGKYSFLAIVLVIYFVEGIVLVSTPALIRDFSPQVGRASAMAVWTIGPVLGSLLVTVITSLTLGFASWQDALYYAAYLGLAVFVIILFCLRELSPRLQNQIMVSLNDRALVEARARDIEPATQEHNIWRDMLRPGIIGSAFGISVYLLFYYTAVGNLVIYLATTFGYSEQSANLLANWYWATAGIALVAAGVSSDRLKVRKPFMLIGALGSIAVMIVFALTATRPETSFTTFAVMFTLMGIFSGLSYAPWMASFTETVESFNPAATGIGLAVWGWIQRIVVAFSAAAVPLVITSVTPLIEHGHEVSAAAEKAGPALVIVKQHPKLFAELSRYATGEVPPKLGARAQQTVGAKNLALVAKAGPELAILEQYGAEVVQAKQNVAAQWQTWWWVCALGMAVFVPFIFAMKGRWRPSAARADIDAHELAVEREMAALKNT